MRVGFIGLGMMGKGMAANLQKAGHELVVHDLSRAAAEPFLAKGAVWANSPKEVGGQSRCAGQRRPLRRGQRQNGDLGRRRRADLHWRELDSNSRFRGAMPS
jgi:3-hydroxyacyl-CoA dehydrogenase